MASSTFYGTGRRKSSIARVYLTPGTGKVTINKKDIDDHLVPGPFYTKHDVTKRRNRDKQDFKHQISQFPRKSQTDQNAPVLEERNEFIK